MQREPNLDQLQKYDLTRSAETILDDIEDDLLSKRRLSKFRETISSYMHEIQLGAALCSSISAVKDTIDLFS